MSIYSKIDVNPETFFNEVVENRNFYLFGQPKWPKI